MPADASRQGRFVPSARRTISPAPSSTFRWREMAGCVISKGAASSITVASPLARRARIARRVGSAKAEKAASRFEIEYISNTLYKNRLIVKKKISSLLRRQSSFGKRIGATFLAQRLDWRDRRN